jgi:putative FmdB family regulatory protein
MPLYEYECNACGHRFEVIQKFSDGPIETCEKCNGPVRKLLSSPAIQFKGSGWYITDYARAGKSESSVPSKPDDASAAKTTSETKTETKVEGKPESKSDAKPETKSGSKVSASPS